MAKGDTRKECVGCAYRSGGTTSVRCCMHMLLTGKRRQVGENGECLSKTTKKVTCKALDLFAYPDLY